MIVRSVLRCPTTRRLQVCRLRSSQARPRRYSTSTSAVAQGNGQSQASMLGAFTNELERITPRFEIDGSQIRILRSPSDFFETLKSKILEAEDRIFLSTLYIGKTENELISTLQKALRKKPKLKLSILTDALRGTRESPNPSCASLLAPLVTEFGAERVEIRMYHTPNLTGLRKKHIPKRINEGWGLQHMKLYGFDDEIIMSGANLSNDYFTNRQDRYHVFSSKNVTDYFFKVHNAVSSLSFLVVPDSKVPAGYELSWPKSNLAPSPLISPSKYITHSTALLAPLITPSSIDHNGPQPSPAKTEVKGNTTIYPLLQLTPLLKPQDTSTELPAVLSILTTLTNTFYERSTWSFTAGYFNPHPLLTSLLLSSASHSGTVITASPWANGFYGSKGVSGLLPAAYTLLSRRFLEAAAKAGKADSVILKEWRKGTVGEKGGWTYHAKGLWISLNNANNNTDAQSQHLKNDTTTTQDREDREDKVDISIIGSSNYTQRSYTLDLEAGVAILTTDDDLKSRLAAERTWLAEQAKPVGMDEFIRVERRVGIRVRIAMWIVGVVGGAL